MTDSKEEKTIGEIIAEARKNAGLSLRTVAAKIPVQFPYLADIEKNRRNPSEKVLRGLSEQSELNLDFEFMMAICGKLGEETERYLKAHPKFGSIVRQIAKENLDDSKLDLIKDEVVSIFRSVKNKV